MKPPNLKQKIVFWFLKLIFKLFKPENTFVLINYPGETKIESRIVALVQGNIQGIANNLIDASKNDQAFHDSLEIFHQRRKIEEQIAFAIATEKIKQNE